MGIEEAFDNLAQATAQDRAVVTNLTDANMNFVTKVDEQSNHMATKDADI